jgi:hypothetical protein
MHRAGAERNKTKSARRSAGGLKMGDYFFSMSAAVLEVPGFSAIIKV